MAIRVTSRQQSSFIGGLLCLIIGIIFLVIDLKFVKVDPTGLELTDATISEIRYDSLDESYRAYVTFSVGGTEYSNIPLDYYAASMRVGNTVKIYYDPLSPAVIKSASGAPYKIFLGVSILLIGIGTAIVGVKVFKKFKGKSSTGDVVHEDDGYGRNLDL